MVRLILILEVGIFLLRTCKKVCKPKKPTHFFISINFKETMIKLFTHLVCIFFNRLYENPTAQYLECFSKCFHRQTGSYLPANDFPTT